MSPREKYVLGEMSLGKNCRRGELSHGEKSLKYKDKTKKLGRNIPWRKMSLGEKHPWGNMSWREMCFWGEMTWVDMSWGERS